MTIAHKEYRKPLVAGVLSVVIAGLGYLAFRNLDDHRGGRNEASGRADRLERTRNNVLTIVTSTVWDGLDAEETEREITQVIEDALVDVPGLVNVRSETRADASVVTASVRAEQGRDQAAQDVQRAVASAAGRLPKGVAAPHVNRMPLSRRWPFPWLAVRGKRPRHELTDLVEQWLPRLRALPHIVAVDVGGLRPLRITLDSTRLAALQLDAHDVVQSLRKQSATRPHEPQDWGQVPVVEHNAGQVVRLGDVANLEEDSVERAPFLRLDGEAALTIGLVATPFADQSELLAHVQQLLPELKRTLPEDVELLMVVESANVFHGVAYIAVPESSHRGDVDKALRESVERVASLRDPDTGKPRMSIVLGMLNSRPEKLVPDGMIWVRFAGEPVLPEEQPKVMAPVREALQQVPGVRVFLPYADSERFLLQFAVQGPEWPKVMQYADRIRQEMDGESQLIDVYADPAFAAPALRIRVDTEKMTAHGIGRQRLQSVLRILDGRELLRSTRGTPMEIRFGERSAASPLDDVVVKNERGEPVALQEVARAELAPTLRVIHRYQRERCVDIMANPFQYGGASAMFILEKPLLFASRAAERARRALDLPSSYRMEVLSPRPPDRGPSIQIGPRGPDAE